MTCLYVHLHDAITVLLAYLVLRLFPIFYAFMCGMAMLCANGHCVLCKGGFYCCVCFVPSWVLNAIEQVPCGVFLLSSMNKKPMITYLMLLQWDILSNGGVVAEMVHIPKGSDPGNSVSLLRVNVRVV